MAKGGEIFILDMGQPVRIVDLAEKLIRLSGYIPGVNMQIKFIGLRPGEKLYEELMLSEEGVRKSENEKIYIASPCKVTIEECENLISDLECATTKGQIIECLKRAVPTFNHTGSDIDYDVMH